MNDGLQLPACRGFSEHLLGDHFSVDAAVRSQKRPAEQGRDGSGRRRALSERLVHDIVGVDGGNASVLQSRKHVTLAGGDSARQCDPQHDAYRPQARRSSAATIVFAMSIAIVSGPTPPGTGVSAPAISATSGCTSPTSTAPRFLNTASRSGYAAKIRSASVADVTELMPTSMTTAPGLTKSRVTNAGRPIAATRMSAVRAIAGKSRVRE